jgi:hypothetical protein
MPLAKFGLKLQGARHNTFWIYLGLDTSPFPYVSNPILLPNNKLMVLNPTMKAFKTKSKCIVSLFFCFFLKQKRIGFYILFSKVEKIKEKTLILYFILN